MLLANWRLIAAAAGAALAFGAGWEANGWRLQREIAELRAEHAMQASKASELQATEERAQRAIEQQRTAAQKEIAHAASLSRTRDEADRSAADLQHQRMLDVATAAAVSASRACQDPGAAGSREAASGAVSSLADVLGEVDREAGAMAAAADSARTAGAACERYVDALTGGG